MATQSIEERLKAAIERASRRLSQEARSKVSGAAATAKPTKKEPGTPQPVQMLLIFWGTFQTSMTVSIFQPFWKMVSEFLILKKLDIMTSLTHRRVRLPRKT